MSLRRCTPWASLNLATANSVAGFGDPNGYGAQRPPYPVGAFFVPAG